MQIEKLTERRFGEGMVITVEIRGLKDKLLLVVKVRALKLTFVPLDHI